MDIFFSDPNDIPLPPDELQIRLLEVAPYPDPRRVAVRFEITPFQKRPNVEVSILNADNRKVAELSVVEAMDHKMEFTMHLREPHPSGTYTARMRLFYTNLDAFEQDGETGLPVAQILDETGRTITTHEVSFTLPASLRE